MDKPWGSIDPNSQHQEWNRWTFYVRGGSRPDFHTVRENFGMWARKQFGSVGRYRVSELPVGWKLEVEADSGRDVRSEFSKFVENGWGPLAWSKAKVKLLAGGNTQLVVIPSLEYE